jgi:site-specific DNA recombinase
MIDAYIRVSRVGGREGENFISPEVQREQIENWAKMRGAEICEVWTDLDMSGARADRPGLLGAIARVESGAIDGIAVAKLDRLARAITVAFDAIARIEKAGGELVSVQDGIDSSTSTGKLLRGQMLLFAEWYREQTKENWNIARAKAVGRGMPVKSTIPTGYRRGPTRRLEPDEAWAPFVADLFARRARGDTLASLAEWFNESQVPVQRGKRWTGGTIGRMLENRVYLGEVHHGDLSNVDAHPAIVSPSMFHAAHEARGVPAPASATNLSLLAGLCRCSGCGMGMWRGSGKGAGGSQVYAYRCRGGGSAGVCGARGFAYADDLDALVEREFMHHADDLALRGSGDTIELDAALAALTDEEYELDHYRDNSRISDVIGMDRYIEGLRVRQARVDAAREHVSRARLPIAGMPDVLTLRRMWPDLDLHARRRVLAAAVDCVVVAGRGPVVPERVRVCWSGLGPKGLPGRGLRGVGLRPIPLDGLPAETRVQVAG